MTVATKIDRSNTNVQRICNELVSREVGNCVSAMVADMATLLSNASCDVTDRIGYDYDELSELLFSRDSWEDTANENSLTVGVDDGNGNRDTYYIPEDYRADHCQTEDMFDRLAEWSELLGVDFGDWLDRIEAIEIDDEDSAREACELEGIEPNEREVYEHWIVSNWFAEKLRQRGETVGDVSGLIVWGRCTTNQSISLDGVIIDIAAEMEILPGMANEWKTR